VKDKVDDDRQRNCADNPGQRSAQGDRNYPEGARRECDDANDDRRLHHSLGLDFKWDFHALSDGKGGRTKVENLRKGAEKAPLQKEGIQSGTVPMAYVMATTPPWFVMRAQKSACEGMSVNLEEPIRLPSPHRINLEEP
jgi:hypothetical protein